MTQLDREDAKKHSRGRRSRSDRSSSSSSSSAASGNQLEQKSRRRRRGRCARLRAFIGWLIRTAFIVFHVTKDWLLECIFHFVWTQRVPCPPLEHEWLASSPFELAAMIRRKELGAAELFDACMRRMNQVNPAVNAIVDGPFADALSEARLIDERIARDEVTAAEFEQKPLLGVPFTIKDSTAARGRLQTLGLVARRETRAKTDAECVRLVREAGGILLATTNVPEVNKWQETRNLLIGQTNNPYDTRRTVGGSSGGEAAAIASCMSPFGLGTDIGGSIRMPAFYCGIYGHKPTVGLVNTFGCTFRTGNEPSTMVVAGPMTRYAGDLLPLMRILCGPTQSHQLRLHQPVLAEELHKLRIFYVRESGELRCSPVAAEMQAAMTRVLAHWEQETGVRPQQVRLPCTENTSRMWRYWMTEEPADFNQLLGNGKRLNAFVELGKKLCGYGEYTLAGIYSLVDALLPAENEARVKEWTRRCDEELTRILGDDGILLYHSYPSPAPFHYVPLINVYNFSYWSLLNVLHVPSTQVPLGLSSDGRPIGIQVVATRNRDRHCLAVAEELGRAFGGWKPPY